MNRYSVETLIALLSEVRDGSRQWDFLLAVLTKILVMERRLDDGGL